MVRELHRLIFAALASTGVPPMFRSPMVSLVVVAGAGVASAQEKKENPIPPPRPAFPMPMPPNAGPAPDGPSPGTLWSPYTPQKYPVPGQIVVVPGNAYAYLPASISAFATPDEFVKILRRAGFADISPIHLALGSVILYTARKETRG